MLFYNLTISPLRSVLCIALLLISFSGRSLTCVALATGNWEVSGTWSCGRTPTCGDSVVIPAFRTVTITTQLDYTGCGGPMAINIFGELHFQSGKKLKLACGSVLYVQTGGSVTGGGGGGTSNLIEICGANAWTSGMGDVSGPATITSGGVTPVPVELLYFKGAVTPNSTIELKWATATETNNDHFVVERSRDGKNFNEVIKVDPNGTGFSLITQNYITWDYNPYPGLSYYRLKQVDKNSAFEIFDMISVRTDKKSQVLIYPNPTASSLNIEATEDFENAALRILNFFGQEVINTTLMNDQRSIDLTDLPSGIYYILLDNGIEVNKNRFSIQK